MNSKLVGRGTRHPHGGLVTIHPIEFGSAREDSHPRFTSHTPYPDPGDAAADEPWPNGSCALAYARIEIGITDGIRTRIYKIESLVF